MALVRMDINTSLPISQFDWMNADTESMTCMENLLGGIQGGVIDADVDLLYLPVAAYGSLEFTATTTGNNETFIICGVTFTAKSSGASGAQFNISATDTEVTAANAAAAVVASVSPYLVGVIDCTAVGSFVVFTAAVPGLIGNGLKLTESLTGCTLSAIAGGTNGTKSRMKSK